MGGTRFLCYMEGMDALTIILANIAAFVARCPTISSILIYRCRRGYDILDAHNRAKRSSNARQDIKITEEYKKKNTKIFGKIKDSFYPPDIAICMVEAIENSRFGYLFWIPDAEMLC